MTESLQNAFSLASQLPAPDQDAFAAWLVAELESDKRWNGMFAKSQNVLAELSREALEEHSREETKDWKTN